MNIQEYYLCPSSELRDGMCLRFCPHDGWIPMEVFILNDEVWIAVLENQLQPVEAESIWMYLNAGQVGAGWQEDHQAHYLNMVPHSGYACYFFLELPPEGPAHFDGRNIPPAIPRHS